MQMVLKAVIAVLGFVQVALADMGTTNPAAVALATAVAWAIKLLGYFVTPVPAPVPGPAPAHAEVPLHPEAAAMLAALPEDLGHESLRVYFKSLPKPK